MRHCQSKIADDTQVYHTDNLATRATKERLEVHMHQDISVSVTEISRASQLPLRQLQFWTEAGVLLANEGTATPGRGGSRTYSRTEFELALFLAAVAHKGWTNAEAGSVAAYLRQILSPDALRIGSQIDVRRRSDHDEAGVEAKRKQSAPAIQASSSVNWSARLTRFMLTRDEIASNRLMGFSTFLLMCRMTDSSWDHYLQAPERKSQRPDLYTRPAGWRGGYVFNIDAVYAPPIPSAPRQDLGL
jgi:DNA-binding transcriptional MerR regulator